MVLGIVVGIILVIAVITLTAVLPMHFMHPLPSGKIEGTDIIAIRNRINNLFFISSGDEWIVIDAGSDANAVKQEMERMSIDAHKVKGVFLTHTDYDHVASIPLFPNAAVYMCKQEEQMIDGSTNRQFMKKNKLPKLSASNAIVWMADNETVDVGGHKVRVIWAPGHTKGSAMYAVDEKYLFSGDAFRVAKGELSVHPYTMDKVQANKTIQSVKGQLGKYTVFTSHYGEYQEMKEKITEVLLHWGLEDKEVKKIYDTAWQIGDKHVLKVYDDRGMLERNLKILQMLDEMNIPVGKIALTQDKQQYVLGNHKFYFLSEKLSGSSVTRIDDVTNTALLIGETIAELHIALKRCEDVDEFWDKSLLDEMNGWVKSNFEENNWKYISREEYEKTIAKLGAVYDKLPKQLIHRDVHFGNFLFDNGEFSGYIDFDLSQRNIRVFDLCYFLLGLLSEQGKLEITEEQWFEFARNAFIGYDNKLELSDAERKAIPYVMECIELLFVSYFESMGDMHCAEDACNLYEFVKEQENRIWEVSQDK